MRTPSSCARTSSTRSSRVPRPDGDPSQAARNCSLPLTAWRLGRPSRYMVASSAVSSRRRPYTRTLLPAAPSVSLKAPMTRRPSPSSRIWAPPHASPKASRRSCRNGRDANTPPAPRLSTISSSSSAYISRYASAGFSGSASSARARRLRASSRKRSRRSGAPLRAPATHAPTKTSTTRVAARARRVTWLWYNSRVKAPAVPVIDRYLIKELVSPFFLGGALFTFFLVLDRIYHLTDLVITKGVPFYLVIQLLVFMLPSFLAFTLPMAFLVAVLLAGGRLAGDLEITAFKAAGVGLLRLFRPILAA